MSGKKISELTDGVTPDDADEFATARTGSNFRLSWAALKPALQIITFNFPFNYEVGGVPIQDDWLTCGTLDAGTVLLSVVAVLTQVWDAGGHLTLHDQAGGSGNQLFRTNGLLQDETISGVGIATSTPPASAISGWGYPTGTTLSVTTDQAATTGNVDVHLLAYVPS